MLISIFTPTNDHKYLDELAQSISGQTYHNYEWVIVPNGNITPELVLTLTTLSQKYDKIKIHQYKGDNLNIGALKNFAASKCTGDILVEVDHDDLLDPYCLQELVAAFSDSSIDFVYSNSAVEGKFDGYSNYQGWKYRPYDSERIEIVSFPPSPQAFSRIWYMPNHVRAWRASFYTRIGGHNKDFDVLDDAELLIRTYINGKVKHLDLPLYIYRLHDGNTSRGDKNAKIQEWTWILYDKYYHDLCKKWSDEQGLKTIELVEYCDLPLPYADGSCGLVCVNDFLNRYKPLDVMREIDRILALGGSVITYTPSTDGRGAFQHPEVASYWNENSFWYFGRDHARSINGPKFQITRLKTYFPNDWYQKNHISYVRCDLTKFVDGLPGPHPLREYKNKFTIVTATIGRSSLANACKSVERQDYDNWEHIVVVDGEFDSKLVERYRHPSRIILFTGGRSNDYGNTPRNFAYNYISGDYVMYLDDDNTLHDAGVLTRINANIRDENWAVFPIKRLGEKFFHDPPGLRRTDTSQIIHKPIIKGKQIRYPAIPNYDGDGIFCEQLKQLSQYLMVDIEPIVNYPVISGGK